MTPCHATPTPMSCSIDCSEGRTGSERRLQALQDRVQYRLQTLKDSPHVFFTDFDTSPPPPRTLTDLPQHAATPELDAPIVGRRLPTHRIAAAQATAEAAEAETQALAAAEAITAAAAAQVEVMVVEATAQGTPAPFGARRIHDAES